MSAKQKPLLRLAIAIHAAIKTSECHRRKPSWPSWRCEEGERIDRQLQRAERLGWHLAAAKLQAELRHAAGRLGAELNQLSEQLPCASSHPPSATMHDVYQDLVALEQEFDAIDFDIAHRRLSVTTEPIHLQNVYLGPFEIRLNWSRLRDDVPYQVIALDPHPSATRADVPHPHITDSQLCEGDGRSAIRAALAQGRLCDFFTLVAAVLRTFNPESPFVALCNWHGRECADCGAMLDEDECCQCARCNDTVCGDCQIGCDSCGDGFCASCSARCRDCELYCCNKCTKRCAACDDALCPDCFRKSERCTNCHEEERFPEDSEDEDESGPAVHADGVGEAIVPA